MLYNLAYPFMQLSALAHQRYHWCLVMMKRRPKLLLKTSVRPETHYHGLCGKLRRADTILLSRLSSGWAARYAIRMFEKPTRMPCMANDLEFEQQSQQHQLTFNKCRINVFCHEPPASVPLQGTILLVHGWEGRSVMFRPLTEKLLDSGYRVIAPDLIAHGSSEGERCSFYDLAQLLLRINQQFGAFHAAIGHSFGGTALAMAIDAGLSTHRLIKIGSPDGLGNLLDSYIDYYRIPAVLKDKLKQVYHRRYGTHPDMIDTPLWKTLSLPTLLCHDRNDNIIDITQAQKMNAAFPNCELFLTDGWGHRGVLKDRNIHQKIIEFVQSDAT
ncbi:alpha/beta hydrolase [Vibrio sp. MEBiC08052]|uniref:alpha/beta hydrolase n=1 Tax=Vibrio sp. MEBiC08052 TaxID=1761910 RepID=UPI0007407C97|nr:alpha/beta fold hydrolase [Vibrio sp. MEBiC08052]KUI98765.1 hypothetical protein VRK_20950 [Vibrio sp. MEBiC08052]